MMNYSSRTQTTFQGKAKVILAAAVIVGSLFPTISEASSDTPISVARPQAELAVARVQLEHAQTLYATLADEKLQHPKS